MATGSRIKKLASETAIYGISSMIGRMFNVLLVPFYTNVFAEERYGIVGIVFAAFAFLNILYTYGMESAYLKFASGSEGRKRASDTFSTATWLLVITSVVLSLLIVGFQDPFSALIQLNPDWHFLVFWMAGILLLDTLTVLPYAELRLQNRPWRFAAIRLINIATNIGLNLFLILGLDWDIEAIFIANMVASGVALLLLMPVYARLFRFTFSKELRTELLAFGLPFLPSGLGYAVTESINRFFLARMPEERVLDLYGHLIDPQRMARLTESGAWAEYVVGIFNGMYKIGIFMMLVVQMFRYAWQPFFLQHAEDSDAKPLFARVFTLFSAVALGVFLAVTFFADELVRIPLDHIIPIAALKGRYLVPPSYWFALSIVPVVLMAYVFQGWYYNFSAGLYIQKKTRYLVPITLIGAVVTLSLNITLVPWYGIEAAAWATMSAYGVMALVLFAVAGRVYPIPYEWGRLVAILGLAAILFAAWFFFQDLRIWWVELLLWLTYVAGLIGFGVVPLKRLKRNRS